MIILVNTETGLPVMVTETDYSGMYKDNGIYSENTAHFVDISEDLSTIFSTWHWDGEGFKQHIPNINPDFIWDSELFIYKEPENYLQIKKDRAINEIKQIAYEKISNQYPVYKQLNITREPTSSEALVMYAYIDNIRNLSNISENNIASASSIAEVDNIIKEFR